MQATVKVLAGLAAAHHGARATLRPARSPLMPWTVIATPPGTASRTWRISRRASAGRSHYARRTASLKTSLRHQDRPAALTPGLLRPARRARQQQDTSPGRCTSSGRHATVSADYLRALEAGVLFGVVMASAASPLTALSAPAGTAASVPARSRPWLAGNAGSPPSPASVVLTLGFLAVAFAAIAVVARRRRHHEAPLRQQMRARPVTFRAPVDVKANALGMMVSEHGPLDLIVHGDAIEVSHPFPFARFLFGQEYCYRAEDTTVKVVPGLRHDWIEIESQPTGTAARIQIRRRNMNRQIWDALVRAGAHPIGPAPPPLTESRRRSAPG